MSRSAVVCTELSTIADGVLQRGCNSTVVIDWEDMVDDDEFDLFGVQVSRRFDAVDVEMCTCTMRIDLRGE